MAHPQSSITHRHSFFPCLIIIILFSRLGGLTSKLYSFYITPYMVQKGYQVQYLEPTKTFLYTKENLSITITEYIPLIQINAAAYFFKTSPIIGHMGVQLEKEDALRFQKWVDVHETNTNRFIPKTIPPQKKRAAKQPPVSLIPNKKKILQKKLCIQAP